MRKIDWEKVHEILISNSLTPLISRMKDLYDLVPQEMLKKLEDMEVIKYEYDCPIINDIDYLDIDEFLDVVNILFKD
ncbi:MAG: hypothetical protein ACOC33_03405 [bacterium]